MIIVLTYSKDQFKNYLGSLHKIMSLIRQKTKHLFVPVCLQNSPVNPKTDMMIIMRSIERIEKYQIDQASIKDEYRLAK